MKKVRSNARWTQLSVAHRKLLEWSGCFDDPNGDTRRRGEAQAELGFRGVGSVES